MRKELTTRETQMAALEVLKTVTEICEQQNLRYYLVWGTLIGAVRHKGFIPWDDDVDIMMPRPDYEKFLKLFQKNVKNYPHLELFNPDTCPNYPYMISRVSDDRYEIIMENEKPYGMGVFVDIYPFDGLGNTIDEAREFFKKGDRLSSFCYQSTRKHYAVEITKSTLRIILKFPVFCVAKVIGKNFFQKQLSKLAGAKEYEKCKYVGCIVWGSGGDASICKKEWFEDYIMMEYEDCSFRIPVGYDALLKNAYGDYMKLPPEKDQIGHHYYKTYLK